jgi:hypothetical protein
MKKIFLALILAIPSLCWGWISPQNEIVYDEMWKLFDMQEIQQAIDLSTQVINDEKISDIDRLHFLVSRSLFMRDIDERKKDLDKIKELINTDYECFKEYDIYYR